MDVDGALAMDPSERCCMCHVSLSNEELDPLSLCSDCQLLYVVPAQDVQMTGSTRHTRFNPSPMDMDGTLAADTSERCCMCHITLLPEELSPLNVCASCYLRHTHPIEEIPRTRSIRQTRYSTSPMNTDGTLAADTSERCCVCHITLLPEELSPLNLCASCYLRHTHPTVDIPRTRSIRQTRYDTNQESVESMLSQQFTDMIDHGNQSVDTVQRSRQWSRVLSDTESDSDASVDIDNFLDNDVSDRHPDLNQLSDDDDEFEEVENPGGSLVDRVRLHRSLATNGRNLPVDWLSEILSPETAAAIRTRQNQETYRYARNRGDYVDSREFDEVMELLAETDSLRRGPPPAAVSFVKNLECMVVDEEFICVICKDNVCVGTVVNRLPCGHVYHPSCIKPWLNARNTCPLCRYELPIDEKDFEKRQNQEREESASSEDDDDEGNNETVRAGRWWFVAAPIVSVVGIGLLVWLGGGGIFDGQRDCRIRRLWSLL